MDFFRVFHEWRLLLDQQDTARVVQSLLRLHVACHVVLQDTAPSVVWSRLTTVKHVARPSTYSTLLLMANKLPPIVAYVRDPRLNL
jgi:hypothetical protein